MQGDEIITTFMIQNLPRHIHRKGLIKELNHRGFEGLYDFCHLPTTFSTNRSKCFAFVNFTTEAAACTFLEQLDKEGKVKGEKSWRATPAFVQGFQSNAAVARSKRMRRVRNRSFRPLLLAPSKPCSEGWPDPPSVEEVPWPKLSFNQVVESGLDFLEDWDVISL